MMPSSLRPSQISLICVALLGCGDTSTTAPSPTPSPGPGTSSQVQIGPPVQLANRERLRFTDGDADLRALSISPDGTRALTAGWRDHRVRQWDLRTGQLLKVYEGVKPATDVVHSADGTRAIFYGGDFPCVVLDLETGQELGAPLGSADQAICIAASPRGDFAATGLEDTDALAMGNVFLWDLNNLEETAVGLHGHADMVYAVAFSPDGKYLASGGRDGLVKIWNVDDRSEMRSFRQGTPVFALAYSPNGLHVISAGAGNTATVWDLRTGQARGHLEHPAGWITAVAIAPGGRIAATGGNQYCPKIHLWDLATGRLGLVLDGHEDTVRDMEFTPDGQSLLSCSDDGTMRLWRLPQSQSQAR